MCKEDRGASQLPRATKLYSSPPFILSCMRSTVFELRTLQGQESGCALDRPDLVIRAAKHTKQRKPGSQYEGRCQ